jgi:hypothetical protein
MAAPTREPQSSEGRGGEFESRRARHFGTKLGTPKLAVFALEAATSVRRSTLLEPMMRTSFASTSTRLLCPLFADPVQEDDKQTGLGRTW